MTESLPKIEPHMHEGYVLVDGLRVWGFLASDLSDCGHPQIYAERWDAYFCPVDDKWLTKNCGDPQCRFCTKRPERPMEGPLDEPDVPAPGINS